jgi:hypothetical protein
MGARRDIAPFLRLKEDLTVAKLPKISEIIKKIEEYVKNNSEGLPILRECCFENNWDFCEFLLLSEANPKVKRAVNMLLSKKEINLEKFGVKGSFHKGFAQFLLERLDIENEKARIPDVLRAIDSLLAADELSAAIQND